MRRLAATLRSDGRALVVGLVALILIVPPYLALADRAGRPLAVFALPPVLAAVFGTAATTLTVGTASLLTATLIGLAGPLGPLALVTRLVIISLAIGAAAIGAAIRERETAARLRMSETAGLYHVFEAGLLPTPHPPPGYAVAVHVVSSQRDMALGGDFLDAVALEDGRLAVVIGDVCGHGAHEAALATAVRAGWRTIARSHRPDPAAWLHHIERTLLPAPDDGRYVTMCTGIVDRTRRSMVLSIAGHPPPIIVAQRASLVEVRAGLPLGIGLPGTWRNTTLAFPHAMVMYTDGLVENRRARNDGERWSEAALLEWLDAHATLDAGDLADALIATSLEDRTVEDDVALMVVQATDGPTPALPRQTAATAPAGRP